MESQSSDQETLYLAYLAARVEQAVSEVENHQAHLAQNPEDFGRIVELMRAVRAVQTARHEYENQKLLLEGPGATQPTEQFRNEQAQRAAQIVGANYALGRKECPRCHMLTPASAARCECGNFFHIGPPLSSTLLAGDISVAEHNATAQPRTDER